jgi:hypothetical protein
MKIYNWIENSYGERVSPIYGRIVDISQLKLRPGENVAGSDEEEDIPYPQVCPDTGQYV